MIDSNQFMRRKHFLILGIIPSIIFLVIVVLSLSWEQRVQQTNTMQSHLNHSYHMFYGELYEEAKIINVLAEQVILNSEIQDSFILGDRTKLQQLVAPYYNRFK